MVKCSSASASRDTREERPRRAFSSGSGLDALEEDPPDTRGAVRDCFDAAENLFKLLTGTGQDLTQSNATATLKPIVDRLHGGLAKATQSHAGRMLSSFADWANAGHPYRHAQRDSSRPSDGGSGADGLSLPELLTARPITAPF